jgi:hypothetical protein
MSINPIGGILPTPAQIAEPKKWLEDQRGAN